MKASSLSLAGSISAKNGTRRSSSYSCARLTVSSRFRHRHRLPPPCPPPLTPEGLRGGGCRFGRPSVFSGAPSFGRHQQGGQRIFAIEFLEPALLLQFAAADHQNAVEIARQ